MLKLITGKDLSVYYDFLPRYIDKVLLQNQINSLPDYIRDKIDSYRDVNEKWLRMRGKFLLKEILIDMNMPDLSSLNTINYSENNKPFLSSEIDFSISHSTDAVICAVTRSRKIGIDLEKIAPIDLEDFQDHFNTEELKMIRNHPDFFFKLWTKKEALAKATGLGVFFDFKKYEVIANQIEFNKCNYLFKELNVGNYLICFMCESEK